MDSILMYGAVAVSVCIATVAVGQTPTPSRCTVPSLPPSSITSSPGGATADIQGLVLNLLTLGPLPGARISIPASRIRVLSDSMGRFRIADLPHGDYQIVAQYLGFKSVTDTITYEGGVNVLVVLSSAAIIDFMCGRPASPPRPPDEGFRP